MPRITEARREARREQVLEAARACLQEHGLEAVSMEMIIARSGLSTGAVYGHFKGKDEIINAVVSEGSAQLAEQLLPVLANPEPPLLPDLVEQVLDVIVGFGPRESGIDRLQVSVHGWSHAQSDPALKTVSRSVYRRLREAYAEAARRSQAAGTFDPEADPEAMAQLLTSITLGFVAQHVLAGGADVKAHVSAIRALSRLASSALPDEPTATSTDR